MGLYKKWLTDFKELFYVNSVLGVILSSCIGSLAAMLLLAEAHDAFHIFQLTTVVVVAMWYNASLLAQLKPRFVFNSLLVSCLISAFWIIWHILLLI